MLSEVTVKNYCSRYYKFICSSVAGLRTNAIILRKETAIQASRRATNTEKIRAQQIRESIELWNLSSYSTYQLKVCRILSHRFSICSSKKLIFSHRNVVRLLRSPLKYSKIPFPSNFLRFGSSTHSQGYSNDGQIE